MARIAATTSSGARQWIAASFIPAPITNAAARAATTGATRARLWNQLSTMSRVWVKAVAEQMSVSASARGSAGLNAAVIPSASPRVPRPPSRRMPSAVPRMASSASGCWTRLRTRMDSSPNVLATAVITTTLCAKLNNPRWSAPR